jgi:hypothetical protein
MPIYYHFSVSQIQWTPFFECRLFSMRNSASMRRCAGSVRSSVHAGGGWRAASVRACVASVRSVCPGSLCVESKKANSEAYKYRDISGDPAAPCASCAGHLFPNQFLFGVEDECYYNEEQLWSFEYCRVSLGCSISPQRRGSISMVEEL